MLDALQVLNGLTVNFALLVTLSFLASLFVRRRHEARSRPLLGAVWLLLHAAGPLFLLLHTVTLAPGLLFDLRNVPIALATLRGGPWAGLLASLPVAAYRLHLGGPGALPTVLGLALVIAGSALARPRVDVEHFEWRRAWRVPVAVFGVAMLPTFLAFHLAGRPLLAALPVYLLIGGLGALGLLCALAVLAARLTLLDRNSALTHLAYRDALTGTRNRRAFEEDFAHAAHPGFLLLLDLDRFKRVNDTLGHDVGDRVLAETARVLVEAVRPSDRVYRLGGEEFVVLLAPCEAVAAPRVAERVRAAVARDVGRRSGLPFAQTVSGGLVPLRDDPADTLRVADEQLYRAKAQGRDRVLDDLPDARFGEGAGRPVRAGP